MYDSNCIIRNNRAIININYIYIYKWVNFVLGILGILLLDALLPGVYLVCLGFSLVGDRRINPRTLLTVLLHLLLQRVPCVLRLLLLLALGQRLGLARGFSS